MSATRQASFELSSHPGILDGARDGRCAHDVLPRQQELEEVPARFVVVLRELAQERLRSPSITEPPERRGLRQPSRREPHPVALRRCQDAARRRVVSASYERPIAASAWPATSVAAALSMSLTVASAAAASPAR